MHGDLRELRVREVGEARRHARGGRHLGARSSVGCQQRTRRKSERSKSGRTPRIPTVSAGTGPTSINPTSTCPTSTYPTSLPALQGWAPRSVTNFRGARSRSRAAFSCNEPTGRLVELIKARRMTSSDFSEASPAGFYSRSPAAHHWSPRRCGVPPNLTESSSPSRVQTTPSVNKWSAASRRSALV